jgi:membrane protein
MELPPSLAPYRQAFEDFRDADIPQRAAALSFYAITALPPLVVLLTAILGLAYSGPRAAQELVDQVAWLFGQATADTIADILKRRASASNGVAAVTSLLVALLGASGFFLELQKALNHVWGVQTDPNAGWRTTILKRVLNMGVVLGTGGLLLASLIASAALAVASRQLESQLGWQVSLAAMADSAVALALIAAVFALLFRSLPDVILGWRHVWRGALLTSLLFVLGKFALGWYLGRSDFAADYGSAGALVLIVFWVYYSSMILLFGAELTKAHALASGYVIRPERHARLLSGPGVRTEA